MRAILRAPRLYNKFCDKMKEYIHVKDSLSTLSKATSIIGEPIPVENLPEWQEFVGEHGSLEQKVVNEVMATIELKQSDTVIKKEIGDLVQILESLDLTPEDLMIPITKPP